MSYTISVTKRTNGGYTVVQNGTSSYPSELTYHGTEDGIMVFSHGLTSLRFYRPEEWTVQSVTGFTTVAQVADALDAMGVLSGDALADIKTLLSNELDVSVASGDLPWNHYTGVASAVTGQQVTAAWAAAGDVFDIAAYDTVTAFVKVTHTDSENDRIRLLGYFDATGDGYVFPIKSIADSEVKVTDHYYELNSDASQNVLLDWDVTGIPLAKFEIQCGATGATPDVIEINYTLK